MMSMSADVNIIINTFQAGKTALSAGAQPRCPDRHPGGHPQPQRNDVHHGAARLGVGRDNCCIAGNYGSADVDIRIMSCVAVCVLQGKPRTVCMDRR